MDPLPHHYRVETRALPAGDVVLESEALPPLATAAPKSFGGPGDRWSPETLLVGAVADCFTLGFRAIASASRFAWEELRCEVEGRLERSEGRTRFTAIRVRARLRIAPGGDAARGKRLLEKAEQACLITNSLSARIELDAAVEPG